MSPDVKELARENLSDGRFPADSRADFRLYLAPEVRRGIEKHAKDDVSVEICGVLVGQWQTDNDGPFARVTDYIRCENASSKFAEVTFTHESWAQINKEMDSKFADARIIGWYHSHPDFGIFLSDRDCFIQQHFFSGAGQVAYVIDPVRDLEGVFAWRNGKPTLLPHFWIGNQIRTADASEKSPAANNTKSSNASNAAAQVNDAIGGLSTLGWAAAALALLVAFWLGHLYGRWRSQWEQRMIIAGAMMDFVDTNLIREGLEGDLAAVAARLRIVSEEVGKLPEPTAQLTKEQTEEADKRRRKIHDDLALCESALARIEQRYGLDDTERAVLAQFAAKRQAALRMMLERESEANKSQKPRGDAPSQPSNTKSKSSAEAPPSAADSNNTSPAAPPAGATTK